MKKGEFVCIRSGNILGLVWKDRNHVRMISNIDGISKIGDCPEMVSIILFLSVESIGVINLLPSTVYERT